jgi:hypothetical protein
MPKVNGKKFSYTPRGRQAAQAYKKKRLNRQPKPKPKKA